jgi:Zn-dependent peptidase ImmA (M78 family)
MPNQARVILKAEPGVSFPGPRLGLLKKFVPYCARALNLKRDYIGFLTLDREKYDIRTTGYCDNKSGKFFVYCKDRAFVDVLRTIAHEMTHMSQYERDEFDHDDLHFSSAAEDDANALAGELVNAFSEVMGYDVIYERKA